jgi:hypothetical protein
MNKIFTDAALILFLTIIAYVLSYVSKLAIYLYFKIPVELIQTNITDLVLPSLLLLVIIVIALIIYNIISFISTFLFVDPSNIFIIGSLISLLGGFFNHLSSKYPKHEFYYWVISMFLYLLSCTIFLYEMKKINFSQAENRFSNLSDRIEELKDKNKKQLNEINNKNISKKDKNKLHEHSIELTKIEQDLNKDNRWLGRFRLLFNISVLFLSSYIVFNIVLYYYNYSKPIPKSNVECLFYKNMFVVDRVNDEFICIKHEVKDKKSINSIVIINSKREKLLELNYKRANIEQYKIR